MKVSEIKLGNLYVPKKYCLWHTKSVQDQNLKYISLRKLDKKYERHIKYRPVLMYLGTSSNNPFLGIKKAHWFLVDGEKIILNNYSIRNLEMINGTPLLKS